MDEYAVSVLIVDDFEEWRQLVGTALRKKLGLCIIEEVEDGLEAVQKAKGLQPDLILLDIGLPVLNGIEAARQIRSVSPKSKVIFLTENHSCDVAQAALDTGASGYVIKSAFSHELISAVETVLKGKQFLSAKLRALSLEPQIT